MRVKEKNYMQIMNIYILVFFRTICLRVKGLRESKDWNGWKKIGWKQYEDVKKKRMVTVFIVCEEAEKHEA